MDSKDEADEVRKFIDDVKKRKRPVQISDFKSFAVAIISELRNQTQEQSGMAHAIHATHSPDSSNTARPTKTRRATASPQHSSRSPTKSISSKAACKHLTEVFHKSFKKLSNKEIKTMLKNADISFEENDFRTLAKKDAMIAQLAAARCEEHIELMKHDTAQL